ncbi:zeta toxin family protein [Streptomyces sp. NPDC004250]|uniref:zeta toxin family protein n=1 Tax=Streptomyces sp. NPDC004250 TaxID=3364692 RepID=UPI0036BEA817
MHGSAPLPANRLRAHAVVVAGVFRATTMPKEFTRMLANDPGDQVSQKVINDLWEAQVKDLVFGGYSPQQNPVYVSLGGQAGAGKTGASRAIKGWHPQGEHLVPVETDFFRQFHPKYKEYANDPRTLVEGTQKFARDMVLLCHRHARGLEQDALLVTPGTPKYSLLVENTMHSPGGLTAAAKVFAEAGYRVEAIAMAVPENLSLLGTAHRCFLPKQDKPGRWSPAQNHDVGYQNMPQTVEAGENCEHISRVTVVNRDGGTKLYDRELHTDDGTHGHRSGAKETLLQERQRPLTVDEEEQLLSDYHDVSRAYERMDATTRANLAEGLEPILTRLGQAATAIAARARTQPPAMPQLAHTATHTRQPSDVRGLPASATLVKPPASQGRAR